MSIVFNSIILFILVFFVVDYCYSSEIYLNFDNFPETTGSVPEDSSLWEYSSSVTNNYPANNESNTSGWKMKNTAIDGTHWFHLTKFDSCYNHIGVDTYGYLTISSDGHSGNSLQYTVTGGKVEEPIDDGSCVSNGTELYNLESYTGIGDVYTGGNIGHPYIYFKKLNAALTTRDVSAYSQAASANRFSFYLHRTAGQTNGVGGYGNPVTQTFQIGIFRDPLSTGYHHYFNYLVQSGGWAKIQVEETTNGDNGGNGSTRYIAGLLTTMWQFYITGLPYGGGITPLYTYKYDDLVFDTDDYANQNNETISNIAIMLKDDKENWEISFNDKYKNAYAYSTYEVRYSFSPITNENWDTATPVVIQQDNRFYIQTRSDGKFQKWWPYYQGVWAPFVLSPSDTALLVPGAMVCFAIKDISQNPSDLTDPVDGINTYWTTNKGGRDYIGQAASFDYANDAAALPYIKRISYVVAGDGSQIHRVGGQLSGTGSIH